MEFIFILYFIIIAVGISVYLSIMHYKKEEENRIIQEILKMTSGNFWYSPEEFLSLRLSKSPLDKKIRLSSRYNLPGVYVIHNITKDMHYVGQSKKVLDRASVHFMGRGNGDVYANYIYGDNFKITFILLYKSNYRSLNELEADTIFTFKAYSKGYNRTRGNRA